MKLANVSDLCFSTWMQRASLLPFHSFRQHVLHDVTLKPAVACSSETAEGGSYTATNRRSNGIVSATIMDVTCVNILS